MELVTGGAGFIGSHLAEQLHDPIVVDNLLCGKKDYVPKNAVFINKDVINLTTNDLKDVDVIYHFAGFTSVRDSLFKTKEVFSNITLTQHILELARKCDCDVVFASTSAVYGKQNKVFEETDCLLPISNYAASKAACEMLIHSYSYSYGIKATVLRYANIYGERSLKGVMHDFFVKLKKDKNKLLILGNGRQKKTYLHVKDCVDATLIAYKKQSKKYDVFNIGSETPYTVVEIAEMISEFMGLNPVFEFTNTEGGWKGDVPYCVMSLEKIKSYGWRERISIKEGLKRYIEWISNYYQ